MPPSSACLLDAAVAHPATAAARREESAVTRRPQPPPTGRTATWRDALGRQPANGTRFEPRSRDELFAVVAESARTGSLLRAVGAGQSTSGAAKPEGAWVDLRALQRPLPMIGLRPGVRAGSYVRAEAGARLEDVQKHLRLRGAALPGAEGFGTQTLAGLLSTASHGASLWHGALADAVVSAELIVLDSVRGRLVPRTVRVEPSEGITCPRRFAADRHHRMDLVQDDALFYGAVVGLGATGIACAYTLGVIRAPTLEEHVWETPWSELEQHLAALATEHDAVEIVLYPHPTGTHLPGLTRDDCIPCRVTARRIVPHDEPARPATVPEAPRLVRRGALGAWGRTSAIELSVPLEDATRAVNALLDEAEAMRREGLVHSGPVTLRFVGASRHALAMSHGRATCSIEAALVAGASRADADDPMAVPRRVQRAIEAIVPTARPHWGLTHELSGAELSARYPNAADWRRACRAFDPRGSFLNAMTRTLLWNAGAAR